MNSTPADCIKFALSVIYKDKLPDLVFSGINAGPNVGPDVMYSGTVAAATEASHNGCKAIALSFNSRRLIDLCEYADYAVELGVRVRWEELAPRTVLNVNFPNLPLKARQAGPLQNTTVPRVAGVDLLSLRRFSSKGICPREGSERFLCFFGPGRNGRFSS